MTIIGNSLELSHTVGIRLFTSQKNLIPSNPKSPSDRFGMKIFNDFYHKNAIVDIEKNQSVVHGLNNAVSSSVTWIVELFGSCHFRVSFGPDLDDLLYY